MKYTVYVDSSLTSNFTLTSVEIDDLRIETDGCWFKLYSGDDLKLMIRQSEVRAILGEQHE